MRDATQDRPLTPAEQRLLERERLLESKRQAVLDGFRAAGGWTPELEALEVEADRERAELDAARAELRKGEQVATEAEAATRFATLSDAELRADVAASDREAQRRRALADALAEKVRGDS